MILDLFYITLIVVFIIDHSGIIDTIKSALAKWLGVQGVRLQPFDCSLCMTWWACLLYIIITGHFTLGGIALCAIFALGADKLADTLALIRDIITKTINELYKLFKL